MFPLATVTDILLLVSFVVINLTSDENIDLRSDIYSLGVTLYELVTGGNPFDSPDMMDIIESQLKKRLPPSENIDRPLFYIISKATEKNPERRYQTAMEFKDALVSYINSSDEKPFPTGVVVTSIVAVTLVVIAILTFFLM